MLTIHSAHFIKLSVEDTVKDQGSLQHVAELEETVNRMII